MRRFAFIGIVTSSLLHQGASFSVQAPFGSTQVATTIPRLFTSTTFHNALPSSEQGGPSFLTDVDRKKHPSSSELSAVAIISGSSQQEASVWQDTIQPIVSASLLVTGSTIGATCLVLPETVAGPGIGPSSLLFLGAFLMNLLSGLAIAEVAIKQNEASGDQVPSSFKEFADINLQSEVAGNVISAISIFVNSCVVSFDLLKAGTVGASLVGGDDAKLMSICFAAIIASLVSSLESSKLSDICSVAVVLLFCSFGGLLLPGLAHVSNPIGTLLAPGIDASMSEAMLHSAPIILLTMVYQNIVPTVTKNLNYDRTKTTAALLLGSFLPLVMYLAWCFTVLGGGIDSSSVGGPLLTAFSIAAVTGSALGCTMSIAQEVDIFLKEDDNPKETNQQNVFSLQSVLLAVSAPLGAGLLFAGGKDFAAALSAAGAYGDPLLYGAIPVAMAWNQRQGLAGLPNLVPGGMASLGLLGVGSAAFLWEELAKDFAGVFGC